MSQQTFRESLTDEEQSAVDRYFDLAHGTRPGFGSILAEIFITLLAPIPGALGMALRKVAYPLFFGEIGDGCAIGANVSIRHPSKIHLGRGVMIDDNVQLDARGRGELGMRIGAGSIVSRGTILSCKGGSIIMGPETNIGVNCLVRAMGPVVIGRNTLLAAYTYIACDGHKIDDTETTIEKQGLPKLGGINIGDDCWLGARTTVLDGVTIGNGAVTGAHSMVNRDIPANAIAVGTPAKVIRYRSGAKNIPRD